MKSNVKCVKATRVKKYWNWVSKHLKSQQKSRKVRSVSNSKLKQDVYELSEVIFDFDRRLKLNEIFPCKNCDGLVFKLGERYFHNGTCDLNDGISINVEVIDEMLQERLKSSVESWTYPNGLMLTPLTLSKSKVQNI